LKLFYIGDGVSQGFMSVAAVKTDLTYSTLIARSMDLKLNDEYRSPNWELDGLPLNLERAFRRLVERYGSNIRGPEWLTVLQSLNNVVDEVEDYYERGLGAADKPYRDSALGVMGHEAEGVDRGITTQMMQFPSSGQRLIAARNFLGLELDERQRVWATWYTEDKEEPYTKIVYPIDTTNP
jgi:hypothetical protein